MPSTPLHIIEKPKIPHNTKIRECAFKDQLLLQVPAKTSGNLKRENGGNERDYHEWSESILAEFNTIIAKEIRDLTCPTLKGPDPPQHVDYKELLHEFGITDSAESENDDSNDTSLLTNLTLDCENQTDKLLRQKHRLSGSLPENLEDVLFGEPGELNNMSPSKDLALCKRNSSSLPVDVSLLQKNLNMKPKYFRIMDYDIPVTAKRPPRQDRKMSLPLNLTNQKRRRVLMQKMKRERIDFDSDDCCQVVNGESEFARSKSLENQHRSAPTTPTDGKKSFLLPKIQNFRKRRSSVSSEGDNGAVLVRVSSLPDQQLKVENGRLGNDKSKGDSSTKRSVSPLTLRSDVVAKRLSESDKDVGRISPVEANKLCNGRSAVIDIGVNCGFVHSDLSWSDGEKTRKNSSKGLDSDEHGGISVSVSFLEYLIL